MGFVGILKTSHEQAIADRLIRRSSFAFGPRPFRLIGPLPHWPLAPTDRRMTSTLERTPLYDWHVAQQGRMVDFAGWAMPVQYTSIVDEHSATRQRATVFDISHMGRLRFDGSRAGEFLDTLTTRRVADLPIGGIRYSLMTNQRGGILDDVLVYHLETPSGTAYFLLVVNASNRAKIVQWIDEHRPHEFGVAMSDRTEETAMIAVQGPRAIEVVEPLIDAKLATMKYYTGRVTRQMNKVCIVSRTGYTGEDGCELIVKAEDAPRVWENLLLAGREVGLQAAGLGARDTLRLEAAMPLYGHELSEDIHPFQAGLGFAVNLRDRDFVGRTSLLKLKEDDSIRRVGLELAGRRVPREHYQLFDGEQFVGEVTSGTFSPTLDRPLAMAYVASAVAQSGRELTVDIRGTRLPARIVDLPFYKRPA